MAYLARTVPALIACGCHCTTRALGLAKRAQPAWPPPMHCHEHTPAPTHPTHPASAAMRAPCMPRCTTPCSAYCRCTSSTSSTQVCSRPGHPLTAGQTSGCNLRLCVSSPSVCLRAGRCAAPNEPAASQPKARAVAGCALCRRARPGAAVRLPPAGGPAPHHLPHLLRAAAGAGAGGEGRAEVAAMLPAPGGLWHACGRVVLWHFLQLEALFVHCTLCRQHSSQRCFFSREGMPGRHALLRLSELRTSAPQFRCHLAAGQHGGVPGGLQRGQPVVCLLAQPRRWRCSGWRGGHYC